MSNETKQCPFCGEIIKINAKKCRFCGEWLEKETSQTQENRQSLSSEKFSNNHQTGYKVGPCLCVIHIINIVMLILSFINKEFGDFFWSNFWAFCLWAGISSGIASSIDKSNESKGE